MNNEWQKADTKIFAWTKVFQWNIDRKRNEIWCSSHPFRLNQLEFYQLLGFGFCSLKNIKEKRCKKILRNTLRTALWNLLYFFYWNIISIFFSLHKCNIQMEFQLRNNSIYKSICDVYFGRLSLILLLSVQTIISTTITRKKISTKRN